LRGETNNEGLVISPVPAMGLARVRQTCAKSAPELRPEFAAPSLTTVGRSVKPLIRPVV
jgi:hypothetical protein